MKTIAISVSVYLHVKKGSPYSTAERRSRFLAVSLQVTLSHKPGGRLPLLSARHAVTLATLNRAATSFSA